MELSIAYVERVVIEQFAIAVRKTEDAECKAMLQKLFQLYALHTIDGHKGWYLENDYMNGAKTKAIRRLVGKLNKEVRADALFLVEAFAIPDALLGAAIV